MESSFEHQILKDLQTPISFPNPDPEILIQDFTRDLMDQTVYLHSTVSTLQKDSNIDESLAREIRDSAYNSICEKSAVISVDLIKNKTMTRTMLARTQQADNYLSTVRDSVGKKDNPFPKKDNPFPKEQVLYGKHLPKDSLREKHVICITDSLFHFVIHTLRVNLNHTSATTTKKNFEQYYYNHNATKIIKSYVKSCVTCAWHTNLT